MRKLAVLLLVGMALASPVRAEETQPCDDMATAGSSAAGKRNNMVKETLNAAIADPDEAREPLANCLSIVHALGDAYSMDVKLPSFEDIIAALCEYTRKSTTRSPTPCGVRRWRSAPTSRRSRWVCRPGAFPIP